MLATVWLLLAILGALLVFLYRFGVEGWRQAEANKINGRPLDVIRQIEREHRDALAAIVVSATTPPPLLVHDDDQAATEVVSLPPPNADPARAQRPAVPPARIEPPTRPPLGFRKARRTRRHV